jgi:hypothetical protein
LAKSAGDAAKQHLKNDPAHGWNHPALGVTPPIDADVCFLEDAAPIDMGEVWLRDTPPCTTAGVVIVAASSVRVTECGVGLGGLLKALSSSRVIRVAVGVIPQGALTVGAPDGLQVCIVGDAENLIRVATRAHRSKSNRCARLTLIF